MVIAVNTRFLLKENLEGVGYFIKEVFSRLALAYPQHRFYFIFDRPYDESFIVSSNITPVVVPPPARHPVLWKYWYDIKIPALLKKIRADVFISPDGMCSLRTRVPQCLIVHDLGFLHQPEAYKRSHLFFFKRYTPAFIKKAAYVATVSGFSKKDMTERYGTEPGRINIVYSAAKEVFSPSSWERQEEIKAKFTEGKEFFIYIGAIQPRKNLVNLLKAFSIFKKRQQSAMKLVLVGRQAWKNEAFLELLRTYKYRTDVILAGYQDEQTLTSLLGAAYALVYPSLFEGFGVPVLEAMKCNVPVLTSAGTSMQEIAGEAGLYFDPGSHTDIAEKMMLIYKDETLRDRLISQGSEVAAQYSWQRTAMLLAECLQLKGKT
ncbi:MAG TPA: glycosyltransferase family 1 protein [Flavisolibacter sp.]|nr:glycosyltransferase family 1 protein [Flavisolibacter sp.]